MALSPLLSIAQRALSANETALSVVGNNIANVNTPGYNRQIVELAASPSLPDGSGFLIGSGVDVLRVSQVVDPLLFRRLQRNATTGGEQGALSDQLQALAGVVNDLEDPALNSLVIEFFDAASALARNPAGLAERETLLGRAVALAGDLNRRSESIATLQRGADDRVLVAVDEANAALARIASLNTAIRSTELSGQRANDLRDERQLALNQVATILPVQILEGTGGEVRVAAKNGLTLVSEGNVLFQLATANGAAALDGGVVHDLGFQDTAGNFVNVPNGFDSGELAGLVAARDNNFVDASTDLDTFALALRDEVNAVQTAGFDLDGNSTALVPMFAGTGAGDLSVLLDPATDPTAPRKVAAALSLEPGDNQNALALADLGTTAIAGLGNVSFAAFLAARQGRVGQDAARARDQAQAADLIQQQLEAQRQSLAGVNLNEELTNLLKFQRAFQAASQLIRVTETILDELLSVVR